MAPGFLGGDGPVGGDGPLVLGLDIGTTAIKAVLLDHEGRTHGTARAPTPWKGGEMAPPDRLSAPFDAGESAPLDLLTVVRQVLGALAAAGRARTLAVGIAGLAESGAAFDATGRPLGPIIAWNDPRGSEVVARLRGRLGADLDRAIGQRLRTVSSVAKLGWVLDHRAGAAGPVASWLGVPELVFYALTGRRVTEYSLAARTGAYHLAERRYLPEVVEGLGVAAGTEVFAPVAAAGFLMGRVSRDGARWSGLPAGIPVTLGGHDHLVGRVGAGAGPVDLANSVGTAEVVVAALLAGRVPDVDLAVEKRVAVTLLPGGQATALLASAARAGLVVAAVARALGCGVEDLDRQAGLAESFRPRAAAEVPGGGHHRHGQPGHAPRLDLGERIVDAALAGQPLNIDPGEAPEATWRSTAAALAARTWDAVDRLALVGASAGSGFGGPALGLAPPGRPPSAKAAGARPRLRTGGGLVVYGGGSRSRLWLDAKARARPEVAVWRSPVEEAVARGAALFAGVAAGWWPSVDAAPRPALERITPLPPPWPGGRP